MALLSGCAGYVSVSPVPDEGGTVTAALEGATQGSVYGGHAPIVGAKVYVLTPSKTANAGASASIMNSTQGTGGGYPVALDTSGGVTNGMYYVTTDTAGGFNLTGDYSCSINQAVYVAAVGGSPTYPSGSNVFTASQIAVSNITGSGATQTGTFTFTTTTTELMYIGEYVQLSGFTGSFAYLNGSTQVVLSTNLTTTTVAATIGTHSGAIAAGTTTTAGTITAMPTFNPAVINMAYLGLCPSSGTFAGTLSFIYMNEISTAALAFASAPFGSDAFHIGVNASGPLNAANPSYVLNGLKQGLNNATNLYDVQGSNQSTTFAGEGHIARAYTPGLNGVVPQAEIDTLGNILAACVDSQNTTSTVSPQCSILFATATANGTTGGTKPTDIATAAFNIAHYPAGAGNTNFVHALFTLPAGNVPFAPQLTAQPNDFAIGIQFKAPPAAANCTVGATCASVINGPQVISIDGGNYVGTEYGGVVTQEGVWVGSFAGPAAKLFASTGVPDYVAMNGLSGLNNQRSMAVDTVIPAGNVWITQQYGGNVYKFSNTGTAVLGPLTEAPEGGLNGPVDASVDASNNVYIAGTFNNATFKLDANGNNVIATGGAANTAWSKDACQSQPHLNALDPSGNFYDLSFTGVLCKMNPSTGVKIASVTGFTGTGPTYFSLDHSNTIWSTNTTSNKLIGYNFGTSTTYTYTGGGLNQPCSAAVDGAGTIWVGNNANESVSAFTSGGTALSPAANASSGNTTVTTGGYAPQNIASNCASPAIDRAGDVWVAYNGTGAVNPNYVMELIGIAAPVVTPTSYASANNLLGVRPY